MSTAPAVVWPRSLSSSAAPLRVQHLPQYSRCIDGGGSCAASALSQPLFKVRTVERFLFAREEIKFITVSDGNMPFKELIVHFITLHVR